MAAPSQLRVLTLREGENLDTTLFRLEKAWTLHFVLGPSLTDKIVRVFTNHPTEAKDGSNRNKYREVAWQNLTGHKLDVYDNFAEVSMVLAGSFNYYFTIDGSDKQEKANGCGYFLVDPILRVGKYDERLPLDSISCQTYLAKQLGPLPDWLARLRVAHESGYNMVHLTPIQELGLSNSAYALKDHLKLNPLFSPGDVANTYDDVRKIVQHMRMQWEMLSLTDLVFNHTANESPWIQQHPECVYNLVNSPHLKPAYLLDRIICHFSMEIAAGKWAERGIPGDLSHDDHLNAMKAVFLEVVAKHKIYEYFLLHVDDTVQQYRTAVTSGITGADREGTEVEIVPDPKCRRLKSTIDIPLAVKLYYTTRNQHWAVEDRINESCATLRHKLDELNAAMYSEVQSHLHAAAGNLIANARYRFVDPNGEKIGKVSVKEPIMFNYFVLPTQQMTVEQEEAAMHTEAGAFCMAHNGWVMNDDPLRNFAEPGSNIYLRRELIPWGDSVKLRYGQKPEDCPYLWAHMRKYTVETARVFHGVRLDNCHSTPIHVAEYMLDEARKVRPDLYVIAELFTSSEFKDNIFINRLGLTSLIREAMSAWDSHELGRLVHRYGGFPVGAFIQPPARPLVACVAHALFMDQTHDNPSPVQKRTAADLLPSTALVSMACCATGSNRGYDEMVPHHIHVVTESRLYQSWSDNPKNNVGLVNMKTGIIAAKRALNLLHTHLGSAGFSQVYVDQVNKDIVSVTRHNPVSHQSVILVARTVFSPSHSDETGFVPPLCVPGIIDEIILEGRTVCRGDGTPYKKDNAFINGLPNHILHLREHIKITESDMVELKWIGGPVPVQEVEFIKFPPGSVIAFRVSLNSATKSAILNLRRCLGQFGYRVKTYSGRNLGELQGTEIASLVSKLSLDDLSRVLYRCSAEEMDDGKGFGAYNIPGMGDLPYCGIQGVMSVLSKIRAQNDLGHPLCENIRNGDWLLHYIANRLLPYPGTQELGKWFEENFTHLSKVPRYLIPCYFDAIMTGVYVVVMEVAWDKLSEFIRMGSSFVRALGMGSLQFCSVVKTATLPTLSPQLSAPAPPTVLNEATGKNEQACLTLAAGLPHFSSGIFRNWGRDSLIALRGLLLLTGRHEDARFIILAYGGCLRHGLIPNLIGSGTHARYNCRDAIWWWLQCIQDYCNMVPGGSRILQDKVARIYPTDDVPPQTPGICDQPLHDVIQEAMQRHAEGVQYRERNAGPAIDNDMCDQGFNNKIGIDWETGFVFGGNVHNCGTWMDKMGSSEKGGNKGKPATPRDGSAVELVGLCKSAVRWLSELSSKGEYPYSGVERLVSEKKVTTTYAAWAELMDKNFEKYFWINTSPVAELEPRPDLINKRGIYKDSKGATQSWTDYQLRPNFPIAMVVAPELFTPRNAWEALTHVQESLLGPLGMKTLDPSDWNYNGNYNNSDDSADMKRARGFNYHQGPEWLWPIGFFLRAKLHFAQLLEKDMPGVLEQTSNFIKSTLARHHVYIHKSDCRSLPELTNQDGSDCPDSCAAQAWSVACVLEVLYDLAQMN